MVESDDLESGYSLNEIRFDGANDCELSRVFGSTGKTCWLPEEIMQSQKLERDGNEEKIFKGVKHYKFKNGRNSPARLIVRDSHLTADSAVLLKSIDTGLYMTEWKFENGIDRITAAANPRQLERVPAGAVFDFEIVYTVENPEQAVKDLQNLAIALAILEDDALGGHGSRGYGKVAFENFQLYYRDLEYYKNIGTANHISQVPLNRADNTEQLLNNFDQVTSAVERQLPSGKN
jgi:CRISPR-associated protein Csm3